MFAKYLKWTIVASVAIAACLLSMFGVFQTIRQSPSSSGRLTTIPALDLPRCDSSEVVSLLDRVIRSTPRGSSIQSIDGHQELSFDREANQRTGQCITHTDDGEVEVKFIVEWLERDKGQVAVYIPAPDLPRCDSSEVVSLLDRVIRSTPRGSSIQSIDGHQELSFDREANQRTGQCITHTDDGEVEVKFIVEWLERDKGQFAVRIPAPDLPRCDSSEVVSLLDRVIRSTPRGSSIQSIDGHQELSFDREANQRTGQCITHTDDGEVEVKFIVEWLERDKGQFAVRLIR